jgi:ribonuclease BN (tRNA processing enzyme)
MKNNNEIVVTPLGTVSPYCKDDKNCPGFLIEINDKRILLDCGSGITRLLNMQKVSLVR